jgi:PTS system nitrogen regulatory IIA component
MDSLKQGLCPQDIALGLDVHGKTDALRAVAARIQHSCRIDAEPIFRALHRREQAGSTGVGNGLAIPHARIPGIDEPVTMFARTTAPIPYGAPDGKPVSEFFVILVPAEGANETHLQLLREVAELFSLPGFRGALAAAASAPAVADAFASWSRGSDDGDPEPLQGLS